MKRCTSCTYTASFTDARETVTSTGHQVKVHNVPVLRCERCRSTVMFPEVVRLMDILAQAAPADEIAFPTPAKMTGEQIKDIRKRLGIPQYRLADLLGAKENTVALWEQGRRQPTGPVRVLLRVLDILARYREDALDVPERAEYASSSVVIGARTLTATPVWSNPTNLIDYAGKKQQQVAAIERTELKEATA